MLRFKKAKPESPVVEQTDYLKIYHKISIDLRTYAVPGSRGNVTRGELALIKRLIEKEVEFQSRREKLVVGSKWVFIVHSKGWDYDIYPNAVVTITNIDPHGYIAYHYDDTYNDFTGTEQFLLCAKPQEENT